MEAREAFIYSMLGKNVHVVVDRPVGYLHGDILYPVNYGYIPGIIAGDGEEQDAYILGVSGPLAEFDGWVVGAIRRRDDVEDKLVVAPEGTLFHQGEIAGAVAFQEQYFNTFVISLLRRSCGVIPYRKTGGKTEILLVYEGHSKCWSLPKGHMEPGETEEETALRELFEETGLTARLDTTVQAVVEYPIPPVGRKQVVFFPGQADGVPNVEGREIERCRWVSTGELGDYLFPDVVLACADILKDI